MTAAASTAPTTPSGTPASTSPFTPPTGAAPPGHLARQGPVVLRRALYQAAVYAGQPSSPDHAYFRQVKARLDGQLALLSVACKLARRCHHTLRNLGDDVLAPAA